MANDISKNLAAALTPPTQVDAVSRMRATQGERSQAQTREAEASARKEAEPETLDEVVSGLNEMVQNLHRNLQFSVDDDSGETVIKVVDRETKEVVRQIPSEEVVRLRQRMQDAAGVLFQSAV